MNRVRTENDLKIKMPSPEAFKKLDKNLKKVEKTDEILENP
jgi:hypothetical protein